MLGDELLLGVAPNGAVMTRHIWGAAGYQGYYRNELTLTRLALRDGLGHIRGLMSTSKAITDRYIFDAYGNDVAPGLHNTTEGNSLRFRWNGSYGYRTLYLLTGQQTTNTATVPGFFGTGMHVGARHYSPSLRRWLQRDPSDLDGGDPNGYGYCFSDPVGYVDRTGLQAAPKESLSEWFNLGDGYWARIDYAQKPFPNMHIYNSKKELVSVIDHLGNYCVKHAGKPLQPPPSKIRAAINRVLRERKDKVCKIVAASGGDAAERYATAAKKLPKGLARFVGKAGPVIFFLILARDAIAVGPEQAAKTAVFYDEVNTMIERCGQVLSDWIARQTKESRVAGGRHGGLLGEMLWDEP